MITRMVRHYLSRFGWEIAGFWLVSGALSTAFALNASPRVLPPLATLEIVGLAWVTIRLILAEDGFKMGGGWRTRPVPRYAYFYVPLGLAAVVVILPAILRVLVFQRIFGSASAVLTQVWKELWLTNLAAWLFFLAVPLKVFGLLVLRGRDGRGKSAAWAILAVILLPCTVMVVRKVGSMPRDFGTMGSENFARELAQGIQRELPDAVDFIGAWSDPTHSEEVPAAKILLKLSLDPPSAPNGFRIRSVRTSIQGGRVSVALRVLGLDTARIGSLKRAIAVLRYADGTYAACTDHGQASYRVPAPWISANEWQFSGDFVSPLSLPEFEGKPDDLLRGLELLFFVADDGKPRTPTDPIRRQLDEQEPVPFSAATLAEGFAGFPWSDDTWTKTIRPLLILRAEKSDISLLLRHMEFDPRIMSVFTEKGWTAEGMPLLRKLVAYRLPLPLECVEALVSENDPTLSADLLAIALQFHIEMEKLEPLLHAQPGFDWPAFAKEAWRRSKYRTDWVQNRGTFWPPAFWAAQEGDVSAFRKSAELVARGKPEDRKRLESLVTSDHDDLIGYLRENIDRMKFDPATRKWGL